MAAPQGLVSFPGIQQLIDCSYTLALGITPGMASMTIAPQAGLISDVGPLVFSFGGVIVATLPDCKVDSGSLRYDSSGNLVQLHILDRRWKWAFPTVNGKYNLRDGKGKLVSDLANPNDAVKHTERTPQELATLLLEAMGEQGFDVADLPNDARPMVDWDVANAAQELDRLCSDLGCRVALQINNKVKLVKLGQGQPLPAGGVISIAEQVDPPEKPDRLEVGTGRVRFQHHFEIEAVGVEADGTVKLLADLSYTPPAGWGVDVDDIDFWFVPDDDDRRAAKQSVWKWYRIKLPVDIPGWGQVTDPRQLAPLLTEQVDTFEDASGAHPHEAVVYGKWFDTTSLAAEADNVVTLTPMNNFSADDSRIVKRGFSIDRENLIVKFGEPVVSVDANFQAQAPTLRLLTAVNVRDPQPEANGQYVRYKAGVQFGNALGTKPRIERRDEIRPWYKGIYDNAFNALNVENNIVDVEAEIQHNLIAIAQEYEQHQPSEAEYAGLEGVNPDGALQSITWSITAAGATTRVQRNQDRGTPYTLSFKRRNEIEDQKKAKDLFRKIAAAAGLDFLL